MPDPVRPERIGRDGKPFKLIKFRSMKPADETESQTTWSVASDPRIGPVGRFDNYYIENWSHWLDVKGLLRSFAEVFRGGGR